MKRIILTQVRFLLIALMCIFSSLDMRSESVQDNLREFYSYLSLNDNYQIELSKKFKKEVNKESNGKFVSSNGFVWKTGDPLPNPAPENGKFQGIAVSNMNRVFEGLKNVKTLDLSQWDVSRVVEMNAIFAN